MAYQFSSCSVYFGYDSGTILLLSLNGSLMLLVVSPAKNLDFESPLPTDKFTQPELLEMLKRVYKWAGDNGFSK